MKAVIQFVLFIIIVVLGYLVYDSIMEPVRLNQEKSKREAVVVQRLKDLRSAELIYKQLNGKYTDKWDSLVMFIDTAEIPVVKMVPDPTDTTFTRTINDTVGYVRVYDSLFHHKGTTNLKEFMIAPFSGGDTIELHAGSIDRGGVTVQVFEAKIPYEIYLKGMDNQYIINLTAGKKDIDLYPGIKVGSMTEPSTDGNWE
jgi:hypothetical protein